MRARAKFQAMRGRLSLGGLLAALFVAAPAAAQDVMPYCPTDGFKLGAGPLRVPGEGWDQLAGRFTAVGCVTGHAKTGGSGARPTDGSGDDDGFPISYGVQLDASYLLASSAVQIPDASSIRAAAAVSLSWSKEERRAPADLTPQELRNFDGGGYNRGFFDLGATVEYGSSADRSEQNVALGGEFRYAINGRGAVQLIPSIVFDAQWVNPTVSDARDLLGLDTGAGHGRFSLRGYWNATLGGDFSFQLDASVFRTHGLEQDLVNRGWAEGEYAAGSLSWARYLPIVGPVGVSQMYVRYALGNLPTDSVERDAFSAGITIDLTGR